MQLIFMMNAFTLRLQRAVNEFDGLFIIECHSNLNEIFIA